MLKCINIAYLSYFLIRDKYERLGNVMTKRKIKIGTAKPKSSIDLFGRAFDIPPGVAGSNVKIELNANREACVDGRKGIIEYYDTLIKLNVGNGTVSFCGRNLHISVYNADVAVIIGTIHSVEYCM